MPCLVMRPHLAGAHQPGLHLVGDVQRAVPLAERLDRLQVAGLGQREAVGRRDRLHDHRGHVAARQRLLHRGQVVERDLGELLRPVGQEQPGEPVVAGGHGQPGVAVVGLDDRHDLAPLGGVPRGLQRDVDGLAAAAAVDDLGQVGRRGPDQRLGQGGPGAGREVVVADVEGPHAGGDGLDQFRVAVPEVVGAAVEVHVDEPQPGHVPDEVALPAVDDQVDAGLGPEVGLARVPELAGLVQHVGLGVHGEDVVVVHRPAFVTGRPRGGGRPDRHRAANP